jgi:hypothetical protein
MAGEFLCGGAALAEVTPGEMKGPALPVLRNAQKGESMALVLRQSTAVSILLGPFLDDYDGVTAETALTISQADVRLSKNGAASAQKNDATSATHDANGYYTCPLNTTDTNTVGFMDILVTETGALPVRMTVQVVEETVFDDLYASAATGVPTAAENRSEMDSASTRLATIATDTTTDIPAQITSTAAALAAYIDTEVAAILEDTGTTLPAQITAVAAQATAIEADTQDIQARIPAALVAGRIAADAIAISGSTTAADNLEESTEAIVTGVATGVPTTTTMACSALTETTDDHYNGRVIIWKSGAANGIAAAISSYDGATRTFTFPATVTAATAGDSFIIV